MRKIALFSCFLAGPFSVIVAISWAIDPYRVFHPVGDVYVSDWEPNTRHLKTAFLSTRSAAPDRPDAFLFGSSTGGAFRVQDLAAAIDPQLRFYNYYVSIESLQGVRDRIRFLRDSGYEIRAAVLLLRGIDRVTPESFLRREPARISGESALQFYGHYATLLFQGFEETILRLIRRRLAPHLSPRIEYRLTTGEAFRIDQDVALDRDAENYYRRVEPSMRFPQRRSEEPPIVWRLSEEAREAVLEIRSELRRSDCRRVIVLLDSTYRRSAVEPETLAFLRRTFDEVVDLSGDHSVSADYHNYYDPVHYRPSVARWMLSHLAPGSTHTNATR